MVVPIGGLGGGGLAMKTEDEFGFGHANFGVSLEL
jgi:hypothetical protein